MEKCTPRNPCKRVTGPEWSDDQCRWCWRKRYPSASGDPVVYACRLRGSVVGRIELQVCTSGRTRLFQVFSCPLHGRCIKFGTYDGMVMEFAAAVKRGETPELWQCNLCKERIAD